MGDGSVENYHHPSSEGTFRVPAPEPPLIHRWIEAKAYHKRSWPCLGGGDYLNRFVGIANTGRPHPVSADGTAFDIHASTLKPVTLPEDVFPVMCQTREDPGGYEGNVTVVIIECVREHAGYVRGSRPMSADYCHRTGKPELVGYWRRRLAPLHRHQAPVRAQQRAGSHDPPGAQPFRHGPGEHGEHGPAGPGHAWSGVRPA